MFSHSMSSCSLFYLDKRSSLYFMMPLSSPLDMSNAIHSLATSVSDVSFIHIIRLPSLSFRVLCIFYAYIAGSTCGFTASIGQTLGMPILPKVLRCSSYLLPRRTQWTALYPTFDTDIVTCTFSVSWYLSLPCKNTLDLIFLYFPGTPWPGVYI